MTHVTRSILLGALIGLSLTQSGCIGVRSKSCGSGNAGCGQGCASTRCQQKCRFGKFCLGRFCLGCCGGSDDCDNEASLGCLSSYCHRRSMAIPDVQPLGSVVRAHYHTMQTNAEAADFIIHRHEFVGKTAELSPRGKDHVVEIAARMRSAPFPVLVERSEHNSDPELDAFRRDLIAQILLDLGNPDAHQRTIVAPAYGKGLNSREAEADYYRFIDSRGGFGF